MSRLPMRRLSSRAAITAVVGCRKPPVHKTPGRQTMPLFSNPQDQGPGGWEPEAAQGRMAKTAGASPSGVFTSDLSVSEYVLLGEAGFEPLGFVVGSSIYHVGLQIGRWNRNQELQVLTQAMYHARELAMDRMRAEADAAVRRWHRGHAAAPADVRVGPELPGVRGHWNRRPPPGRAGRAPRARWPGLHLRPVGAGLLPAAGRRRRAGARLCSAPASTTSPTRG